MSELRNALERERNRSILEISQYEERVRAMTRELEMSRKGITIES